MSWTSLMATMVLRHSPLYTRPKYPAPKMFSSCMLPGVRTLSGLAQRKVRGEAVGMFRA
jgi:hypothetical protein